MDGIEPAESQWLTQLAAMREAIAGLKLPKSPAQDELSYGSDLELDLDEDYSSPATVDDIWDVISSDDETSDDLDEINGVPLPTTAAYDRAWLEEKCLDLTARNPGLDAGELAQQITATLATDSGDDELQMSLAEIVGFDDLDLVIELIAHRAEILSSKDSGPEAQTDGLIDRKSVV